MGFTVAIMQPYFIPYAGYFRLFSQSDLFVVFDCVQFPRRGWVHRNRLRDLNGDLNWLTLPLGYAPQDTLIHDVRFASDAPIRLSEQLRRFSLCRAPANGTVKELLQIVEKLDGTPAGHIVRLMQKAVEILGLRWNIQYSSTLKLPPDLRGQDRIIEIARQFGATDYLNSPGGIGLYDPDAFERAGLRLSFLDPYEGPWTSILQRFNDDGPERLRAEFASLTPDGNQG